ncbi:MAG TPA: MFS transporter [Opitutales bacterium]|nr:MFS transporter [Opitutales bacterium]
MATSNRNCAWWIPPLYLAEGLPSAVVTGMAGVALLDFGHSAAETAVYTSLLALPWAFKPFWAPAIERFGTQRRWIISMQATLALLLAALAWVLPEQNWLAITLALLGGIAFASATHDIAADGFYIAALDEHRQAEWSGVRNTFFRLALLAGNGGLVWLAGHYEKSLGLGPAWTLAFMAAATTFGLMAVYDNWAIPRLVAASSAGANRPAPPKKSPMFTEAWGAFVQKPAFLQILAFILLYRFAEGQVQSSNKAFFLAKPLAGGLGLSADAVGLLYGTYGTLALILGGILGGLAIARTGLRRQLWPMAAAMNLPNLLYVWMAWAQPQHHAVIGCAIFLEQFGYGFGFAAFMVYLLYVSRGEHATAHYAICSALMAVGVALAGLVAAEVLSLTATLPGGGYRQFFTWVMASTVVSFATLWKLPLAGDFGQARRAG